jgi:AhpD family alkylhydroperoxidase
VPEESRAREKSWKKAQGRRERGGKNHGSWQETHFAAVYSLGKADSSPASRVWNDNEGEQRDKIMRLPTIANLGTATFRKKFLEMAMSTFGLIEYKDASAEVRAVYDDIMATRKTDWVNNFWKAIAHDPASLRRTWESIKQVMAPGALDALTKEMIYIAVSVTNNCTYCIYSHTASAFGKGMTDAMFKELQAVIGMANETNKLVTGYQVEVDEQFKPPLARKSS